MGLTYSLQDGTKRYNGVRRGRFRQSVNYDLVIVGAGPAGLSAAAHAQKLGLNYLLLESSGKPANTIQRYQKGKHVMAEPAVVPLRSDLGFAAGTREAILGSWQSGLDTLGVNIRYSAEVTAITGPHPEFRAATGQAVKHCNRRAVVLAIGLQGNPRKIGVDGESKTSVQYTLDDPDEYSGETIVVIGAGDAAIENAVALARNNAVVIVNRRDEFARAKEGNLTLITRAIEDGSISCFFNTGVSSVEPASARSTSTPKPARHASSAIASSRASAPFRRDASSSQLRHRLPERRSDDVAGAVRHSTNPMCRACTSSARWAVTR